MKCPHCNQEHPDSTKYCPCTGEKIVMELNIICHNENCSNYQKRVISVNAKFCPECGRPTGIGYRDLPYSDARWSTLEEFEKGDIIADHIMLGGAYPYEYLFGEAQTQKEGSTLLIPISGKSFALMPIDVAYEDGITEKIDIIDTINDDFLSLSEMAVEWMLLDLDENPLFREIGLTSSNEIANNINVLESLGYLRIKNFMKPSPNHTFVASFVSNKRNSTGGYTFIVLFEEYMYVFNDVVTEWTSYQEGVML